MTQTWASVRCKSVQKKKPALTLIIISYFASAMRNENLELFFSSVALFFLYSEYGAIAACNHTLSTLELDEVYFCQIFIRKERFWTQKKICSADKAIFLISTESPEPAGGFLITTLLSVSLEYAFLRVERKQFTAAIEVPYFFVYKTGLIFEVRHFSC